MIMSEKPELIPVHCDTLKGNVEGGTSTEVSFTFSPTAPGVRFNNYLNYICESFFCRQFCKINVHVVVSNGITNFQSMRNILFNKPIDCLHLCLIQV